MCVVLKEEQEKKYASINGINILINPLYYGEPYIILTSSGYHVAQGSIEISGFYKFYDSMQKAVDTWNRRTAALIKGGEQACISH